MCLTGAPTEHYFLKGEDTLKGKVKEAKEKDWIMVTHAMTVDTGLVGHHAFSLLSSHDIISKGKPVTLLKI
jgi:hypothetical protein